MRLRQCYLVHYNNRACARKTVIYAQSSLQCKAKSIHWYLVDFSQNTCYRLIFLNNKKYHKILSQLTNNLPEQFESLLPLPPETKKLKIKYT